MNYPVEPENSCPNTRAKDSDLLRGFYRGLMTGVVLGFAVGGCFGYEVRNYQIQELNSVKTDAIYDDDSAI